MTRCPTSITHMGNDLLRQEKTAIQICIHDLTPHFNSVCKQGGIACVSGIVDQYIQTSKFLNTVRHNPFAVLGDCHVALHHEHAVWVSR